VGFFFHNDFLLKMWYNKPMVNTGELFAFLPKTFWIFVILKQVYFLLNAYADILMVNWEKIRLDLLVFLVRR